MSSPALILVQPLQSLPSLLALGDLRQRTLLATQDGAHSPRTLAALFALDPLVTLRGLRMVRAPMHGTPRSPATIRDLVDRLGTSAATRLLEVSSVDPLRTRRIRMLWLRTVARACAAEFLAIESGKLDPEAAYLDALLRDLDSWIRHLGLHHNGQLCTWHGDDLVRHWGLGLEERRPARPHVWGERSPVDEVRDEPARFVDLADALARAAGFAHPDAEADDRDEDVELSAEVARAADVVRHSVAERFGRFGLPVSVEPGEMDPAVPEDVVSFIPDEDYVPRLLDCRNLSGVHPLETIAVAAALRYLDFDRAFVIGWNPEARRIWVRAKADRSRMPLSRHPIRPTEREADAMAAARETMKSQMLVRGGASDGLCGHIAADRAILLPLVREQRLPKFLVLDRATTARPLDLVADSYGARELAGFLTLLLDNLGLRLRRVRAQRNATLDALTGLANRGVGIFALERSIAAAKRSRKPLCVMMLDMDDFKTLNDDLGHLVGDQALRVAASVLRRTVRGSDTICRYGGEEFLVILPDTEPDEAMILATRLFTEVADAGKRIELPLTVSIGLASLRPNDDLDSLVARADGALYASKSRGRNRFSADTD